MGQQAKPISKGKAKLKKLEEGMGCTSAQNGGKCIHNHGVSRRLKLIGLKRGVGRSHILKMGDDQVSKDWQRGALNAEGGSKDITLML